jgi:hypothetical protein
MIFHALAREVPAKVRINNGMNDNTFNIPDLIDELIDLALCTYPGDFYNSNIGIGKLYKGGFHEMKGVHALSAGDDVYHLEFAGSKHVFHKIKPLSYQRFKL